MNFELLKDAYAIIDGIPEKQFNLNRWVEENDNTGSVCDLAHGCGTVACAGGWLSLHPKFNELGLKYTWKRGKGRGFNERRITYKGNDMEDNPFDVLGKTFDIGYWGAQNLFSAAGGSKYDADIYRMKGRNTNHKTLFKYRVKHFLKQYDRTYTKPIR
jgi:hypothetical protein